MKSEVFLVLAFLAVALGINEITNLPGVQFDVKFKHYSGYLQASETRFLHYWFVESQNDPSTDPLVFWYNGGPGCSSLIGLLNEMGPYQVNNDGATLRYNPDAWNQFASVVYIEAPAGVGYSYVTGNDEGNSSDVSTAIENYAAIKDFFNIHPDFRDHKVFITGESYGGIYVPTLVSQILDGQKEFHINLQGMAIGNGVMSFALMKQTEKQFFYYHGMIDEQLWNTFEKECCNGCADTCNFLNLTSKCQDLSEDMLVPLEGIDDYDIYQNCENKTFKSSSRESVMWRSSPEFECTSDEGINTYLNRPDVRQALNIKEDLPEWLMCGGPSYTGNYTDMTDFIKKIVNAGVRTLLYYGDTDSVCNFLHAQKFCSYLGLDLKQSKQSWIVDGQIGGFKTLYDKNLTFITIRGSGHMAPQWRSSETAYAIKQFFNNQDI